MGIHDYDLRMLDERLPGWKEGRVAVLGSQWIRETGQAWSGYAADNQIDSTIFDWNGEDGATKLDLCLPLPAEFVEAYDVVLNFGTSEHCHDQPAVFTNIHIMCKPGGAIVHSVPAQGYWRGHSPYKYTAAFFPALCELNGYTLLHQDVTRKHNHRAVLIRPLSPFKALPPVPFEPDYAQDNNNTPPS